ncbi:hypothetical protein L226DRAFT_321484 [Lentinus tigrinus ALCF2SS1-7]|uniref:uncharacterized protein n=1 Tax=Lentinus tigrinus ALCF2SS1-7 TaxID=1328758 RepID=UPI001166064F|nr:hypothetical protein L226DRAFT_321484 [Lentinus tigrinus ALCF2SS1-7]
MKTLFVLPALVATAIAQKVIIASPAANTAVKAGSNVVVAIDRPASETRSTDVAVIIGLQPCRKDGNCDAVASNYARVLYHGPFTPKPVDGHSDPSHNYTVKIPQNTTDGKALLQVAHFYYAGIGNNPQMETLNAVLQITS